MSEYNGWKNRQTWAASLYCYSREDVEWLREELEATAAELPPYISEFLQIDEIDWEELLQHYEDNEDE